MSVRQDCGTPSCRGSEFCELRCAYTLAVFEAVAIYDLCGDLDNLVQLRHFLERQALELNVLAYLELDIVVPNVWGSADGEPYCEGQVACLESYVLDHYVSLLELGIDAGQYVRCL